jgi:hypothetical protein
MKKFQQILSYVLVAALASTATLFAADRVWNMKQISKLDQLSNLIEERFIGETDRTAMEDAAASAMIASLGDEWSYYIPAAEYRDHVERMENAYVGIGVTIVVREGISGFEVTKVNAGGPADEAGMRPGDVIVAIEGQSTDGMDTTAITDIARYFERELGYKIPPMTPFVGEAFNLTRAGIHADGLMKDTEIYNIFDTEKILNRPAEVAVSGTSGAAGIAHWINNHIDGASVTKQSPIVVKMKEIVERFYDEGRNTLMGNEELTEIYNSCNSL